MDCISIVKMDVKELRKAVKEKFPKTRVSTMNKKDLSAILLGVNKPKTSNEVNIKKESNKQLFKRLTKETKKINKKLDKKEAIANKNITMSQLKKRPPKIQPPLKKPTIPPPLRPPALPPQNTESFKKALTSVRKKRTINELKEKLPPYINYKKNKNKFKSMLKMGIKNSDKNVKCENYIINNIYPHIDKKILNNPANKERIEDIIIDNYYVINHICEFVNGIKERELKTNLSSARKSLIEWNKMNYKKNGKLKKRGELNIDELHSINNHINNLEKKITQVENLDYTKAFTSIYEFFNIEYGIINEINSIS